MSSADLTAQQEAQKWIEEVTGKDFDQPFANYLKDGTVLCELANIVHPGSVKSQVLTM